MDEPFDINKPLMLHDGRPVRLREDRPRLGQWYQITYEDGSVPDYNVFTESGHHFDDHCPPLRNRPDVDVFGGSLIDISAAALEELEDLRAWKAAAIEKHQDLAPVDPYLKRARALINSEAMKTGEYYYDEQADGLVIRAIIRALKEGMAND